MSVTTDTSRTPTRDPSPTPTKDAPLTIADFLNPTSMLTPGIAGSLTMMITNTLSAAFALPPPGTGIVVSFLFGTLLVAATGSLWSRTVYYVCNSLIIFCMAFGTANVANSVTNREPAAQSAVFPLIGSAYAAEAPNSEPNKTVVLTPDEIKAILEQVLKDARERIAKALEEQQAPQAATAAADPIKPATAAAEPIPQVPAAAEAIPPEQNAATLNTGRRVFFQQWKF